ncbi:MAG: deoxynucleoside kinase [Flavobacteriales bacterium]|nr:deoxynucleoside kinase [Flavobacteriales bacterium]
MISDKIKKIAIEGVIGVGKSTLTKLIADQCQFEPLFEAFYDNPYLEDSYHTDSSIHLKNEIFFLNQRVAQLTALNDKEKYISDYYIGKCLVFARINLQAQEYDLFAEQYYNAVIEPFQPDAILYLKRDLKEVQRLIKERNRSFEMQIDQSYLEAIDAGYEKLFSQLQGIQVIKVDVSEKDFLRNQLHFHEVIDNINSRFQEDKMVFDCEKI